MYGERAAGLAIVVLLAGLSAADGPVYELPADKKAPVLTIDYRGGLRPPRKDDKPLVSILADGTIMAENVKAGTKLGADELQDLLRFVIAKHKLMEFDGKAVHKKARGTIYITDQPDTIVTIAIKGRTHTARYYASTWAAQHFPKVEELQSLEAVRKRLHSIWCLAQLGGPEKAKKLLALANRKLEKEHPKVAALTLDDLNRVYPQKDGSRRLQIARWNAEGSTVANVTLPKKGEPTAEVWVGPR